MDGQYSEEKCLEFLEYVKDKGLINPTTGSSRIVAVKAVLAALDASEKVDLRTVDLESVFNRFVNLRGKRYGPSSLRSYRSRFDTAMTDFIRYTENPAGFKSQAAVRKRPEDGSEQPSDVAAIKRRPSTAHRSVMDDSSKPPASENSFDINVPIRQARITISNVPTDLTASEAERICNVIRAYAHPTDAKEKGHS